jgi:hypothetical protein
MAKSKAQIEYAQKYFKNNPETKTLWLNPQGEFFTDINWANNSLNKDEDGKVKGKLEVFESDAKETDVKANL